MSLSLATKGIIGMSGGGGNIIQLIGLETGVMYEESLSVDIEVTELNVAAILEDEQIIAVEGIEEDKAVELVEDVAEINIILN